MPSLRLIHGTTTPLKIGSVLAIHDDCCCGPPVDPIYYCAECRGGVYGVGNSNLPVSDYPDFVLDEVAYTITGYPSIADFGAVNLNTFASDAWDGLDLINGTIIAPVHHSTSPGTGATSETTLGTLTRRIPVSLSFATMTHSCPNGTMVTTCTGYGPSFPNYVACPPTDLHPFTSGIHTCCCEITDTLVARFFECGRVQIIRRNTTIGYSIVILTLDFVSQTVGVNAYRGLASNSSTYQWSGNKCSGAVTVSFTLTAYTFDPFSDNLCTRCISSLPSLTTYTISITATPTWVVPP